MAAKSHPQDQKNRAMEALERRFSLGKAEVLQLQKKNKITPIEEVGKEITPSADSSANPKLSLSMKDGEENGLAYSQLSQSVDENLLTTLGKLSSKKETMADKLVHNLLQSGDSAQKYMQGSRSMKIDNWILLDNFVQGRGVSTGSRNRALRNHSKRSRKHMSMTQLKKCGCMEFPKDLQKFDKFKPMHDMWKDYATQLLKATAKSQLPQCLLTADLHGAPILVAECKVTAFTGVSGIMVRETAETFGIICRDDKLQVVPKKGSVFLFQVDCWKITLHGDKLASRKVGL